jgi:hypothetical protein
MERHRLLRPDGRYRQAGRLSCQPSEASVLAAQIETARHIVRDTADEAGDPA